MRKTLLNILSLLTMSMLPAMSFSAVHYVKANGTGDGSSWANAAGNLQTVMPRQEFATLPVIEEVSSI